MKEDIFKTIYNNEHKLTKNSKKIANFIVDFPQQAQYLTITALAESCNVSEASVTRLCKHLGYSGYSELKIAIAQALAKQNDKQAFDYSGNFESFIRYLFDKHTQSLKESVVKLNETKIREAVSALYSANHVYCFGQGASQVIARETWIRFLLVSNKFITIDDSHAQVMSIANSSNQDVLVLFSYSGSTRDSIELLKEARKRGVKIILITNYDKSPAARLSDIVLLTGSSEGPLHSGSVEAKIAQLFVIDVLYHFYFEHDKKKNQKAIEDSIDAISVRHL